MYVIISFFQEEKTITHLFWIKTNIELWFETVEHLIGWKGRKKHERERTLSLGVADG